MNKNTNRLFLRLTGKKAEIARLLMTTNSSNARIAEEVGTTKAYVENVKADLRKEGVIPEHGKAQTHDGAGVTETTPTDPADVSATGIDLKIALRAYELFEKKTPPTQICRELELTARDVRALMKEWNELQDMCILNELYLKAGPEGSRAFLRLLTWCEERKTTIETLLEQSSEKQDLGAAIVERRRTLQSTDQEIVQKKHQDTELAEQISTTRKQLASLQAQSRAAELENKTLVNENERLRIEGQALEQRNAQAIATHETNKARINKEIYGLVCDASRKVLANNPVGWQMFFGAMTDAARAGDPLVVQYLRQLTGDGILPREWHVGEAQIEQILEGYYGRLLAKISDEVMRQRGSDCLLSK